MRKRTIFPAIPQASHSLDLYLSELRNIPLITAEEEIRLARRIQEGDQQALEQLVRANLRFVVSVAKQYQNTFIPLMDLISEGNIGLIMAAQRFDETKGFKFISYAVWWIRKLILEAITEQGRLVRLPGAKILEIQRLKEAIATLEQELEHPPSEEELADYLQLSPEVTLELLQFNARRISLYAPLAEEPEKDWFTLLPDAKTAPPDAHLTEVADVQVEIAQLLAPLPGREQEILRRCFGIGVDPEQLVGPAEPTFDSIGEVVGLCGERVRVLKNRALLKLRMFYR